MNKQYAFKIYIESSPLPLEIKFLNSFFQCHFCPSLCLPLLTVISLHYRHLTAHQTPSLA